MAASEGVELGTVPSGSSSRALGGSTGAHVSHELQPLDPKAPAKVKRSSIQSSTSTSSKSSRRLLGRRPSAASSAAAAAAPVIPMGVPELPLSSLQSVAQFILRAAPKNVVVVLGDGIPGTIGYGGIEHRGGSAGGGGGTSSSIFFRNAKDYLGAIEDVFDSQRFREDSRPFFDAARMLAPRVRKLVPSEVHSLVVLLHRHRLLRRCYSENFDDLELAAGLPASKLVQMHGTLATAHCPQCQTAYSALELDALVQKRQVPYCRFCIHGVVRPDIVFFGEEPPQRFHDCLWADMPSCDLLLVIGAQLATHPFSSLFALVPPSCPRVVVHRAKDACGRAPGPDAPDQRLNMMLGAREIGAPPAPLRVWIDGNTQDTLIRKDCDEAALALAKLLGWGSELEHAVQTSQRRAERLRSGKSKGVANCLIQ